MTTEPQPAETLAGLRLGLSLLALVPLVLVLGPLALLVHDQWGPLVRVDTATSAAAERLDGRVPGLSDVAAVLTDLGDPLLMTAVVVVGAVALAALGRRRTALFLVVVRVGSLLLSQGTKAVVDRARPTFEDPVARAFGASFPSGHSLGSAATYTAAAVVLLPLVEPAWRRVVLAVAVVVPVVVAATRVLLGVHYLSDVLAGLVLGSCWTVVCTAVFLRWRRDHEQRTPDLVREGLEP